MKRRNDFEIGNDFRVIGVMGSGRGCGSTHFCMLLAVFFSTFMGRRVALVEQTENDCYRQAGIILGNFPTQRKIYEKVEIFMRSDSNMLPDILSSGYDIVVIDFGSDFNACKTQFLMCSKKIIVVNLSYHKLHEPVELLARMNGKKAYEKCVYMACFGSERGIRYLRKKFGISVRRIPFIPDPFRFTRKEISELWEVIKEI